VIFRPPAQHPLYIMDMRGNEKNSCRLSAWLSRFERKAPETDSGACPAEGLFLLCSFRSTPIVLLS
jgi:hypothetical protein